MWVVPTIVTLVVLTCVACGARAVSLVPPPHADTVTVIATIAAAMLTVVTFELIAIMVLLPR